MADGVHLQPSKHPFTACQTQVTDHRPPATSPKFSNSEFRISDSPPNSYLLSPVKRNAGAFSLTEVVIALGIFAVSMVGVLALFPVASSSGRESSEETQAAILAQMIFDELRASAQARGATNAWVVRGQNTGNSNDLARVNLNTVGTYTLGFDVVLRDVRSASPGRPMIGPPIALKATNNRVITNHVYSNALTALPGVMYLAQLRVSPLPVPGLTSVSLDVSTPANANLTNRRAFGFATLVHAP